MKTEKLIKLAEKIEKNNEAFKALTKPQKRVVIAKDCLARIDIGQINPNGGFLIRNIDDVIAYGGSLQGVLNNPTDLVCQACAKGGLFLSLVGRVNKYESNNLVGVNSINNPEHQKLLTIFTPRQLAYIELAFEGSKFLHGYRGNDIDFTNVEYQKARVFCLSFNSDNTKRMIAICKNIIKNKGTFKL